MNLVTEALQPVLTRAALSLKSERKVEFQGAVFQNSRKFPKQTWSYANHKEESYDESRPEYESGRSAKNEARSGKDAAVFDIKKARHEVLNFAMNNQRIIKNKRKMQIFQAIKLGAKPPKKPYKNYKELLDERKRLKTIREERKKFHQLGKNQAGMASVKCKSKTDHKRQKREPVTSIAQHYGSVKPKFKKKK